MALSTCRLRKGSKRYIELPVRESFAKKEFPKEKVVKALVDLNKADSVELVALPKHRPCALASRILKFRKALGGFADKAQS